MTNMTDEELKKAIAVAYWKAEQRWQAWRQLHPEDNRDGVDYSGSSEEEGIAADWRIVKPLFEEWKKRHPAPDGHAWGIAYPSHEPELYKLAK